MTLSFQRSGGCTLSGNTLFAPGKTNGDRKSGWRGEWAIPFDALGLKPVTGQKVAFNVGIYRAEDEVRRCLEGTLGENWRLDQAATLQFK